MLKIRSRYRVRSDGTCKKEVRPSNLALPAHPGIFTGHDILAYLFRDPHFGYYTLAAKSEVRPKHRGLLAMTSTYVCYHNCATPEAAIMLMHMIKEK